jgi:hypothetical protein
MTTAKVKKFDWMAGAFYPLSVLLMETFWVSPLLKWAGTWPVFQNSGPVLSVGSVFLVLGISLLLTRLTANLEKPMWLIQLIVIGGAVVTILMVAGYEYRGGYTFLSGGWFQYMGRSLGDIFKHARPVLIGLPAMIYLWWRGIVLGQSTSYFKDIYRTFLVGVIVLVLLIIVWQLNAASSNIEKPGNYMTINVIAFFFFGLISIAISHLYQMRAGMPKEEASLTSVWRWLPVMLGVIGGVVLIGIAIASILTPGFFDNVGHLSSVILGGLSYVAKWVLYPIGYAAEGIMAVIKWLVNLLKNKNIAPVDQTDNISGPFYNEPATHQFSSMWGTMIKWTLVGIILVVVCIILIRTVSRSRAKRRQEDIDEERESIFSWKGLGADLKSWLGMLGDRFRRHPTAAPYDLTENDHMDIRTIYRHMQFEAGNVGVVRQLHETADEFAERLHKRAPDAAPPVDDLTQMYKDVRYGKDVKMDAEQTVKANSKWQQLKERLKRLLPTI